MPISKEFAQSEKNLRVLFKILNTAGTPTIVNVSPLGAAGDISIVDTAAGIYDVTIKNCKGPQGVANIQATPETTSLMAAVTARSYTGDDLAITIHTENDASTDTDTSTDVIVEAF